MTAKSNAPPDLSSTSGEEWLLLGEGNANVVFSYAGRDPELKSLVLRLRKTKAKAQSALDVAIDEIVWKNLNDDCSHRSPSSAADRDAAFARRVAAPLLGPQYLLLPRVVAVPSRLRLSLEKQLGEKGRGSRKRKQEEPGGGEEAERRPSLEARGALLRNAARWEGEGEGSDSGTSLCVELKPKCGLPHGHGRRTKVRLKQQLELSSSSSPPPPRRALYCPSDLFSAEAARRRRALGALLADALARDFSHSAPRAAHFRLFDGEGEPLEGAAKAARAVSELRLGEEEEEEEERGARPRSPPPPPSTFKLLINALDSILSFEPLLPRLIEAQRCPECPTAAVAAESLAVLRGEVVTAKKRAKKDSSSSSSSVSAAASASCLRSYLTATSARDLSVMILLRGRGRGRGNEKEEKRETPFVQRDPLAGGAVDLIAAPSTRSSSSSSSRCLLRYRIALCDLDAKPSSKAELHAAADERFPRSGVRRRGEK